MKNKISNCVAIGCAGGFRVSDAEITDCQAIGNIGDGFQISNSVVDRCIAKDNGGVGFVDLEYASLLSELNLPSNTDPKDLGVLLLKIIGKNSSEAEEIIKSSGFLEKAGKISSPVSIISSLLSISANPNVHALIMWLLSA